MTTLTEFLLARIAEDEAVAERAVAGLAVKNATGLQVMGRTVYDPARVLAECDAKRRIVDAHRTVGYQDEEDYPIGDGCYTCGFADEECETLCALALPFADHPDYREEWKP